MWITKSDWWLWIAIFSAWMGLAIAMIVTGLYRLIRAWKGLPLVLLLLLFTNVWAGDVTSTDKGIWDYSKVKNWHYKINMEVIMLMPEDFVEARNHYFDLNKYPDRHRIVAFTVWHQINGKMIPLMFVQARLNLSPTCNDFGHEVKHIINYEHKKEFGAYLFPTPCDDWK